MITEADVNRVLPVVADSWEKLRRSDVERLLNQTHYLEKKSLVAAGEIVAAKRPDLKPQIDEAVKYLSGEYAWD